MNEKKTSLENLRIEYIEANANRRHYSNLRFAMFTVFFAVTGAVVSVAFGLVKTDPPPSPNMVIGARIAGLFFTGVFFYLETLCDRNRRHFGLIAKELEEELGYRQFSTRDLPQSRNVTWAMYVILILFWLFSIFCRA